jgi:hypothetical protein
MFAGESGKARRFAHSGIKKKANDLEKVSGDNGKMVS